MARKMVRLRDGEVHVVVKFTRDPDCGTVYVHPSWWVTTFERNPDIELAGPCSTKAEALAARRKVATFRPGLGYVFVEK